MFFVYCKRLKIKLFVFRISYFVLVMIFRILINATNVSVPKEGINRQAINRLARGHLNTGN